MARRLGFARREISGAARRLTALVKALTSRLSCARTKTAGAAIHCAVLRLPVQGEWSGAAEPARPR